MLREVVRLARGAGGEGIPRQQRRPGGSEEGPGAHRGAIPEVNTCPGEQ